MRDQLGQRNRSIQVYLRGEKASSLLRPEYGVQGVVVGGEVEKGHLTQCCVKALCVIVISESFILWAVAASWFVRLVML